MAQFIHLFDERNTANLRKIGIKAIRSTFCRVSGVFVFPQIEDFMVNHQWMRELRRYSGQTVLAARIRIHDDETVLFGKYNQEHIEMTAAESVGMTRKHNDPMGLEVIIPRAILPKEIKSIYKPPKIVGWRYYPGAHGKKPCGCEYCQRGEPFSRKLRKCFHFLDISSKITAK